MNFALSADYGIKSKEIVRKISTWTLLGELKKKLYNMKVTIMPSMTGAFGSVTKGLLKRLGDLEVGG